METRRVTLLSNRSILMYFVERLLTGTTGIELGVVTLDDPEWEVQLAAAAPDAILVDSGNGDDGVRFASQLLRQFPQANLISLDLEHPVINVHRVVRIPRSDVDGLLEAIRAPSRPDSMGDAGAWQ